MEMLAQLFGVVCGQNPEHTWMPGGLLLPCCQRCLGLYVGAGAAVGLHLWFQPPRGGRFLEVHGLFLLQMVPFGFHWLPQEAIVRTVTGALFGFGVATFLMLTPLTRWMTVRRASPRNPWSYAVGTAVTLTLLPALAAQGGRAMAVALTTLALAGALALAVLAALNLGIAGMELLKWARRGQQPIAP